LLLEIEFQLSKILMICIGRTRERRKEEKGIKGKRERERERDALFFYIIEIIN